MKLKLEIARNNASLVCFIRQTNELMNNQEKVNDELKDQVSHGQDYEEEKYDQLFDWHENVVNKDEYEAQLNQNRNAQEDKFMSAMKDILEI